MVLLESNALGVSQLSANEIDIWVIAHFCGFAVFWFCVHKSWLVFWLFRLQDDWDYMQWSFGKKGKFLSEYFVKRKVGTGFFFRCEWSATRMTPLETLKSWLQLKLEPKVRRLCWRSGTQFTRIRSGCAIVSLYIKTVFIENFPLWSFTLNQNLNINKTKWNRKNSGFLGNRIKTRNNFTSSRRHSLSTISI